MGPNKLACLIVLLLLLALPSVLADEIGSPPTAFCTWTGTKIGTATPQIRGAAVDRTGNYIFAERGDYSTGTTNGRVRITKISPTCGVLWTLTSAGTVEAPDSIGCKGANPQTANYCDVNGLTVDAAGDVVVALGAGDGFWLAKIGGTSGQGTMYTAHTVPGAFASVSWLSSIRVNDTTVAYLLSSSGADRLARYNASLGEVFNIGMTAAENVKADAQPGDIAYIRTDDVMRRIDQASGAILHTGIGSRMGVAHLGATTAFGIIQTGTTTNLQWYELNKDTFATVTAPNTPTPSVFQVSGVNVSTSPQSFDVDAAGNILVCGTANSNQAFAARVNAVADATTWGTLLPVNTLHESVSAGPQGTHQCLLDYVNGFYVPYADTNGGFNLVRHYTGGGFVQQIPPGLVTPPGTITGPTPVVRIRDFCTDVWGFDCGWLFVFGGLVGGAGIAWEFSRGNRLVVLIGAFVGLAAGIFFDESRKLWLILVVIFIIVAFASRRLFGGRTRDE